MSYYKVGGSGRRTEINGPAKGKSESHLKEMEAGSELKVSKVRRGPASHTTD